VVLISDCWYNCSSANYQVKDLDVCHLGVKHLKIKFFAGVQYFGSWSEINCLSAIADASAKSKHWVLSLTSGLPRWGDWDLWSSLCKAQSTLHHRHFLPVSCACTAAAWQASTDGVG
jgi:hypothetical protein